MTTVLPWQFVRIVCVVGVWRMLILLFQYLELRTYAEFSFPSLNIYSDPCMEEYFILAGTNLPFSVF